MSQANFRRHRVFLVEDNPDDVAIARRAFSKSRFAADLAIARDGAEAVSKLKALCVATSPLPDLVLLDINLPKLSGIEVLAAVRRLRPLEAVPFVVLSASIRDEDIQRAYELGVNSYIQKPVVFEELVRMLELIGSYWFECVKLPRSGVREATHD